MRCGAFGDYYTALAAAGGICAALVGRQATGKGQRVLASLLRTWNSKLRTILTSDLPCDHWGQQLEIELAELPADDVLILGRPFTLSQLREAIANLLFREVKGRGWWRSLRRGLER